MSRQAIVYMHWAINHHACLMELELRAASLGIKIVRVFQESKENSRDALTSRPVFRDMMRELHIASVKVVLVHAFVSVSRLMVEQEVFRAYLKERGVELMSICGDPRETDQRGISQRDAAREAIEAYISFDHSQVGTRLWQARIQSRIKGNRLEGRKPFGFFPGEKQIIEKMQSLRQSGMGYEFIASALNASGVPSRSGGDWYGSTIRKILGRLPSLTNVKSSS
jgi:DNA invertase Pin-like site-specific DNA recombinase